MNRREFIRRTILGAAALAIAPRLVFEEQRAHLVVEVESSLRDWGALRVTSASCVMPDGEQYRWGVAQVMPLGKAVKPRVASIRAAHDVLAQRVQAFYVKRFGGPMPTIDMRPAA